VSGEYCLYSLNVLWDIINLDWIKFILSGESPVEREKAKKSLKNTLI